MSNRASGVSSVKILIVDRNSFWTQWATQVLETDGYEVKVLESLEEAADLLGGKDFDLVVLGADIAKKQTETISKLAKRPRDPIRFLIIYPVRPSYSMLRLLWKAGASEIQLKPYNRRELLAMIASESQAAESARWHLSHHRQVSAHAGAC